jgi:hypothetical protein
LPVILASVILIVILGVIFGSRIRQAVSSPTATPTATAIVVTATATGGSGAAGLATATPGGPGKSTPLPGGTPPPTVPGLQTGMITHKQVDVQKIQSGANAGNPQDTYYLDPIQVVQKNLPHYGFTSGFQIISPAQATPPPTPYTGTDGRPEVDTMVSYQGRRYKVSLEQPATRGPKGIWLIVTILAQS